METEPPPPYESRPNESKEKSVKLFFLGGGGHSRNSSTSSLVGEEASDSVELLSNGDQSQSKVKEGEEYGQRKDAFCCKMSGSCMCKLSVVFYLAACIIVSALYVAFFGKNQAFFGDAWIPGKPTVHDKPAPSPSLYFQDLPYTEWISERWTYHQSVLSPDSILPPDWPSLPQEVDSIRQIVGGRVGGVQGLWLLTDTKLFFASDMHRDRPEGAKFSNVSQQLDLEVATDSYIFIDPTRESHLYLVSTFNVTYLDCQLEECELIASTCGDLLPFDTALTSCSSLSDGSLWLGTTQGLFTLSISDDGCISFSNVSQVLGPVHTLAWRSVVTDTPRSKHPVLRPFFFMASVENLLQPSLATSNAQGSGWTDDYWSRRRKEKEGQFGVLAVGTASRVYFYDGTHWWFEWVSLSNSTASAGIIDAIPTAMAFAPCGELYIANSVLLTRVNINYTFDRIGATEGLPYNRLTSLHVSLHTPTYPPLVGPRPAPSKAGTLWIGTGKGYTLLDLQSLKFVGYFYGPRWLPGGSVLSIAGSQSHVMVLTDKGMAVVHPELWTLNSKARHYQSMFERHRRAPGLVSECALTNYSLSSCTPSSTDSDGLWTSWMAVAEAFRHQVTQDPTARNNAWSLFSALQFLVNVTDIEGFMAHTVASENSSAVMEEEDWHESGSIPGWFWRGDSGSDQVVGHMWAYPIIHDLVAQGQQQQQQVREVLQDVIECIKNNQYMLMVDVDNRSTPWWVWSPVELNLNRSWASKRGQHSLQILSYLLSAYRITTDNQFLQGFKDLFFGKFEEMPTFYGLNMVNQKISFPLKSNDELSFLPYFLYYYSLKRMDKHQLEEVGVEAEAFADLSIQRTWRLVRQGKSSAWTAMFAYITGAIEDKQLLEQLVWGLRKWPLELIEWPSYNSHRLDIRLRPDTSGRGVGARSMEVLPGNERTQLHWDSDPFLLDREGSSTEVDPGPWLLPYWMARWCGML